MHMGLFQVFVLLRSLYGLFVLFFFFSFESLNLLGNRNMEIYSVGIQMVCHDLVTKSVQMLKEYLAVLFAPFTK